MTPTDIAKALAAEFTIQHRVGGTDATLDEIAEFVAQELRRGPVRWAYYNGGGKNLCLTSTKGHADQNADGFKWDNPRVRRAAVIDSIGKRENRAGT